MARPHQWVLFLVSVISVLVFHFPHILRHAPINGKSGDFSFYDDGAASLIDFDLAKKFKFRPQPIMAQHRELSEEQLGKGAKWALIAYPNPSFKFGYSLLAAMITAPLPQSWFKTIYRLVLVNVVINSLMLWALINIVFLLGGGWLAALGAACFTLFDISNVHNSYLYQSHTGGGLILLVMGVWLYFSQPRISPFRFALVASFFSLSLLTSSHIPILAAWLGLYLFVDVAIKVGWRKVGWYVLAGLVGVASWPFYVFKVERAYHLKELGFPTYFSQFAGYHETVSSLIGSYPLFSRFIWDFRLFNGLAWWIGVLLILLLVLAIRAKESFSRTALGFVCVFVAALAINCIYTQPISRAHTPYTLFAGALIGVFVGRELGRRDLRRYIAATILTMVVANYLIMVDPWGWRAVKPSPNFWVLSQLEEAGVAREEYFDEFAKGSQFHRQEPGRPLTRLTIRDFVAAVNSGQGLPADLNPNNLTIRFRPIEIAMMYSATRLYRPEFQRNPVYLLTTSRILTDYRFFNDLLIADQRGLLATGTIRRRPIWFFDFEYWDQEYNYVYGHRGGIRKWLSGTALESLDLQADYEIDFAALAASVARWGEDVPETWTALPESPILWQTSGAVRSCVGVAKSCEFEKIATKIGGDAEESSVRIVIDGIQVEGRSAIELKLSDGSSSLAKIHPDSRRRRQHWVYTFKPNQSLLSVRVVQVDEPAKFELFDLRIEAFSRSD